MAGVALSHVARRTDGHDKANHHFSQMFCERVQNDFWPSLWHFTGMETLKYYRFSQSIAVTIVQDGRGVVVIGLDCWETVGSS
jgi:hypothetical protein